MQIYFLFLYQWAKIGRGNIQILALYSVFPLDIANVYLYQIEKTVTGMQYLNTGGNTLLIFVNAINRKGYYNHPNQQNSNR